MKKKAKPGGERELQRSRLNAEAASYLERARKSLPTAPKPADFAVELGQELGFEVGYNRYLAWENGDRSVPAAAVLAAHRITGLPVADPTGERTLVERLQSQDQRLDRLERQVQNLLGRLAAILDRSSGPSPGTVGSLP